MKPAPAPVTLQGLDARLTALEAHPVFKMRVPFQGTGPAGSVYAEYESQEPRITFDGKLIAVDPAAPQEHPNG